MPATAAPDALPRLGAALAAVAPTLNQAVRSTWAEALSEHLVAAHITTPRRLAAFVGQCALESAGFHALEESLGYSALRLCQVWPARFPTLAAAQPFAFQPEALANQVYANRMGNGGAASGDGWRFRGRGLIQLTGRSAYQRFAASCGQSLDAAVAAASTPAGAAQTAVWFWTVNGLNALADAWALDRITLRINCATQAEPERAALCNTALHALGG
ncbi:MAG: glycoside hydrolase family 19 protein [Rhodopila sp.]